MLGNVRSHSGVCMVGGGCLALQCFSKTLCGVNIPTTAGFKLSTAKHLAQKKSEKKNEQFGSDECEQADQEGGSKRASPVVYPVQPSGLQEGVFHILSAPLLGNNCSQDFE